ncbi:MAG: NADH-quinone oxidoreductase subunit N [Thermosulfidibacteraceae bacterium]|jgi:NADH-quinone oxidoreductase subunit N
MSNFLAGIQFPDITAIIPEVIALIIGCLILLIDPFIPKQKKRLNGYIALFGFVVLFFVTLSYLGKSIVTFFDMFSVDNFSTSMKLFFFVANFVVVLISLRYLEMEDSNLGEYYALLMFATVGMMVMVSSKDLIMFYIGLETMAIPLYVLAGFIRMNERSAESALKYLLMGVFVSGIFLYGIALTYGATGSTKLVDIVRFTYINGVNPILFVAIILIACGLGLEIAMVPFHFWAPDVYEGAPTSVTAFISVVPKVAAIAALLRVYFEGFTFFAPYWQTVLWLLSALTMIIGNVTAVVQDNVKRMLAYSSVAHAGYMLMGILSFNELGVSSLVYYFFAYSFMNIGAFALVIYLRRKNIVGDRLEDFRGLAQKDPIAALVMVVFLLSLAGVPPTVGFVGKFLIFSAALKAGFYWLLVIAVVTSVISLYYYFKIARSMYLEEPVADEPLLQPLSVKIAIFLLAILTVVFGVYPTPIMNLADLSAKVFFGY